MERAGSSGNPLGAIFAADLPSAHALERVIRHYEAADRSWRLALKQLQALQARKEEAATIPIELALRMAPPPPANWVRSAESPDTRPPAAPDARPSAAPDTRPPAAPARPSAVPDRPRDPAPAASPAIMPGS